MSLSEAPRSGRGPMITHSRPVNFIGSSNCIRDCDGSRLRRMCTSGRNGRQLWRSLTPLSAPFAPTLDSGLIQESPASGGAPKRAYFEPSLREPVLDSEHNASSAIART